MALAIAATAFSSFSTREVPGKTSFPGKIATWLPRRGGLNATKGPFTASVSHSASVSHFLQAGRFGSLEVHLAGSDPELLKWFAQAELMHARWAMLAVAGILIPEWLESFGFIENFSWYDAGAREYFADPTTLFVVQLALMGWVEGRRWADMINPGRIDIEPTFPNKKKPKPDDGGLWFDPFMWGRGLRKSRMGDLLCISCGWICCGFRKHCVGTFMLPKLERKIIRES